MYKKIIFTICLIIGASILCCLSFTDKIHSPHKTTVQFASWGSESEISILKPILVEFEKENPSIRVEFLHIPQNYFQKIHLLFASNTSPDVIFINNQYLPIYANAGVLEDLSSYSKYFNYDKFYSKSINAMKWNNKIYAVPRDVSNLKPVVRAIHAGLECGLFLEKYPNLDMISFGPTLRGVHAPGEKLELSTVDKFTKLLQDVIETVAEESK